MSVVSQDSQRVQLFETKAHPYLHELECRMQQYIKALELHYQNNNPRRAELRMQTHKDSPDDRLEADEALEQLAVSFMADTFRCTD